MMTPATGMSQRQRMFVFGLALCLLLYFLTMDTILYRTLQSVTLVEEQTLKRPDWSPFRPLSMKLLMTDHCTHYIIAPTSEYFNKLTKFSEVFYFITPNMITITHLLLALLSARLVYSASLRTRRIGVLVFQLRTFLDSFDGTVYRSRAANKLYTSDHNNFGFWMDSTCDVIAGFVLCFAVVFHFWWKCPPPPDPPAVTSVVLPRFNENGQKTESLKNGIATENHVTRPNGGYSKAFIFWRMWCFGGGMLSMASGFWDQVLLKYTMTFTAKLDKDLTVLQTDALHSGTTWILVWLWRCLEGQALLQWFLLAIFIDKVWEFVRATQYTGFLVISTLIAVSVIHINNVRHTLKLT